MVGFLLRLLAVLCPRGTISDAFLGREPHLLDLMLPAASDGHADYERISAGIGQQSVLPKHMLQQLLAANLRNCSLSIYARSGWLARATAFCQKTDTMYLSTVTASRDIIPSLTSCFSKSAVILPCTVTRALRLLGIEATICLTCRVASRVGEGLRT